MKSPFPGMDPYLERHWPDVHATLIGDAKRALNRLLPSGLAARVEERVAVEIEDDQTRHIAPDVRVIESPIAAASSQDGAAAGGVVIEAPYRLVIESEPLTERFIRIVDADERLITVIEFLSPANKHQPGLAEYRKKRAELLRAGVHLVEVDLVRAGDWRAVMRPETCPRGTVTTYRTVVRTAGVSADSYLFPIPLRQPLPDVPIPLRPADRPVELSLQPLLDACYEDSRYDQTIDYGRPLDPALSPEDEAWASELVKVAGRR